MVVDSSSEGCRESDLVFFRWFSTQSATDRLPYPTNLPVKSISRHGSEAALGDRDFEFPFCNPHYNPELQNPGVVTAPPLYQPPPTHAAPSHHNGSTRLRRCLLVRSASHRKLGRDGALTTRVLQVLAHDLLALGQARPDRACPRGRRVRYNKSRHQR